MLTDLTLQQILLRILATLLVSGLLGLSLAGFARLAGDKGPSHDGRLTPNPFVHLDLFGLVSAVFSRAGWVKPVAFDSKVTRGGLLGVGFCVLLSLVVLLVAAIAVSNLRHLPVLFLNPSFSLSVTAAMEIFCECAVWTALFNLIPIPPLAAGSLLTAAASPRRRQSVLRNQFWLSFALVAFMVGTGGDWLRPVAGPLTRLILG